MSAGLLINDPRLLEIKRHSTRYTEATGKQGYLYAYAPGGTGPDSYTRFVFGGGVIRCGIKEALSYARTLGTIAEQQEREAAQAAQRTQLIESIKDIT